MQILTHAVIDSLLEHWLWVISEIIFQIPIPNIEGQIVCAAKKVWEVIQQRGYRINNLDSVLIAQRPAETLPWNHAD